jgi:multiple sugar transport system permease protein
VAVAADLHTERAGSLRAGPLPRLRQRMRGRTTGLWGYLVAALVLLALISVYPLFELVRLSFSNVGPTNLIGSWPWAGLANFRAVLANPLLWQSVRVTAELTAILLVSDLVLGFVVAAVLIGRSRTTSAVMSLMVFVWALPPLVSGSVWKFLLASNGVINSGLGLVGVRPVDFLGSPTLALWSVGLVTSWAALPFATLVLRGGMLAVPRDVIEAAAIDGARYWRIQLRIVAPLLRPTIGILAVLAVIYSFQSFNFIYALTGGGPGSATANVPFFAYQQAFTAFDLSPGAATALLALVVVLILAIPYTLSVRHEETE